MQTFARTCFALAAVLTLSCAAPGQFMHRGEMMPEPEARRKYEQARTALRTDPGNMAARANMKTSAEAISTYWRDHITELALTDTMAAATQVLQYTRFREEVANFWVQLRTDDRFAETEASVRAVAAGMRYAEADSVFTTRNPKRAYALFRSCSEFEPRYRDVDRRIAEAYAVSLAHVAILPFVNDTQVRGLGEDVDIGVVREMRRRSTMAELDFTELVESSAMARHVSHAPVHEMSPEEAADLGRAMGADRVLVGRLSGERSDTRAEVFRETVYRRIVEHDGRGADVERFVKHTFEAVVRERAVRVDWRITAIAARDASPIIEHTGVEKEVVHTVYSDFMAEGNPNDYWLLPPAVRRADPERWERVHKRWRESFGTWELPELLDHVKDTRITRQRYRPSYIHEFLRDPARPVYLDDLPPDEDIYRMALRNMWEPVAKVLKELDRL